MDMTQEEREGTREEAGLPVPVSPTQEPRYGATDMISIRAAAATGVLGASGWLAAAMVAIPAGQGLGYAALAVSVGAMAVREMVEQGLELVHRNHGMAHAPGEHTRMALAVRNALAAIIADSADFEARRQKAIDLMRSIAIRPLDEYYDEADRRRTVMSPQERAAAFEKVGAQLTKIDAVPAYNSIPTRRMEKVLRAIVVPTMRLLESHSKRPAAPTAQEVVEIQEYAKRMASKAKAVTDAETDVKTAKAGGPDGQNGTSPAMAIERKLAPPPEPAAPTPWQIMVHDLTAAGHGVTVRETERLRDRLRSFGTEYLSRERRREISTLVDVHLAQMAQKYAKAAQVAEGSDADRLIARAHTGLLPVLETLREAHAECVRRATDDLDVSARFIETRHPIVPDEFKPIE
jgi:hypothetical protein